MEIIVWKHFIDLSEFNKGIVVERNIDLELIFHNWKVGFNGSKVASEIMKKLQGMIFDSYVQSLFYKSDLWESS